MSTPSRRPDRIVGFDDEPRHPRRAAALLMIGVVLFIVAASAAEAYLL